MSYYAKISVMVLTVAAAIVAIPRAGLLSAAEEKAEQDPVTRLIQREHQLGGERSAAERFYYMESVFTERESDGSKRKATRLKLYLQVAVDADIEADVDAESDTASCADAEGTKEHYICRQFVVEREGELPFTIPELKDFEHTFQDGIDAEGQIFGIDQSRFRALTDGQGRELPVIETYWVYNSFVDFHSFINVLSAGAGIQELERIGDETVHFASFSRPPVTLNKVIQEGSMFVNGEITLQFEGIGLVREKPCALVRYNCGDSSFIMHLVPAPDMEVKTTGYSHYSGTMSVGLESCWAERVELNEVVVARVMMADKPLDQIVTLRRTLIESVSGVDFSRLVADIGE